MYYPTLHRTQRNFFHLCSNEEKKRKIILKFDMEMKAT